MTVVEKVLKKITEVLGVIAGIMILCMMLLAVLDVVLRIVFKAPIIGATEIIQILNVGIVVALGAGTIANQHVTVDFVMDMMPKASRFWVQLAADILNVFVLALMTYCSFTFMLKSRVQGYTYSLLRIPEWPFVGLIALGLLGGICGVLYMIIRRVREFRGKSDGPQIVDSELERALEDSKKEDDHE